MFLQSQGRRGDSLRFTTLGSEAGQFKGTASCANGECAVQIFGDTELGGFGLTDGCVSDAPGIGYVRIKSSTCARLCR